MGELLGAIEQALLFPGEVPLRLRLEQHDQVDRLPRDGEIHGVTNPIGFGDHAEGREHRRRQRQDERREIQWRKRFFHVRELDIRRSGAG